MDLADLRLSYTKGGLLESEVRPDPIEQFEFWFGQAMSAGIIEPNAMILATADEEGFPSARMVLLKEVDADGFVWYTNYGSRKARDLAENPRACLLFYWPELERQVRIRGAVTRVEPAESDAYFESRPAGHKLAAWASHQSAVVESRGELDEHMFQVTRWFGTDEVPRPPFWGGFRLRPSAIEFWQGRPNRLHDRIEYVRSDDGRWNTCRLAP